MHTLHPRPTESCLTLLLLILPFFATGSIARAQETQPSAPALRIAKETTHITGPLRDDGTPDYVTAYNAPLLKLPAEKNAFVWIVRACGPRIVAEDPVVQRAALKVLGVQQADLTGETLDLRITPQNAPPEMARVNWAKKFDEMSLRPATEVLSVDERSTLDQWFKAQGKPIALLERAASCESCLVPAVADERQGYTTYVHTPSLLMVGYLFPSRAALRASAGDLPAASKDLLTALRLARLLQQQPSMTQRLYGFIVETRSLQTLRTLVTAYAFNRPELDAMSRFLDKLPRYDFAQAIDTDYRFGMLDRICQVRGAHADSLVKPLMHALPGEKLPEVPDIVELDLNLLLRLTNEHCDRFAKALEAAPDPRKLWRAAKMDLALSPKSRAPLSIPFATLTGDLPNWRTSEEFNEFRLKRQQEIAAFLRKRAGESREAFTTRVAELINMPPAAEFVFKGQAVSTSLEPTMTRATLALAAYWADHRDYPPTLKVLLPEYLPSTPQDPYSSDALIYRKTADGFDLYSLGPNGVDDGGSRDAKLHTDDILVRGQSPTMR